MKAKTLLFLSVFCTAVLSRAAAQSPAKKAIVLEEYVFMKGPTRDCHASSLLELANGDLLCAWFGGTREGAPDVNLWLARKPKGGQWPKDKIPWIKSDESDKITGTAEVLK